MEEKIQDFLFLGGSIFPDNGCLPTFRHNQATSDERKKKGKRNGAKKISRLRCHTNMEEEKNNNASSLGTCRL